MKLACPDGQTSGPDAVDDWNATVWVMARDLADQYESASEAIAYEWLIECAMDELANELMDNGIGRVRTTASRQEIMLRAAALYLDGQ